MTLFWYHSFFFDKFYYIVKQTFPRNSYLNIFGLIYSLSVHISGYAFKLPESIATLSKVSTQTLWNSKWKRLLTWRKQQSAILSGAGIISGNDWNTQEAKLKPFKYLRKTHGHCSTTFATVIIKQSQTFDHTDSPFFFFGLPIQTVSFGRLWSRCAFFKYPQIHNFRISSHSLASD